MNLLKISAAGNDFLILGPTTPTARLKSFIVEMCDRHNGIGADGVLMTNLNQWWFFNADGGEAEFCGNGARALAFAESQIFNCPSIQSRTCRAGAVSYSVNTNKPEVTLTFSKDWIQPFTPSTYVQQCLEDFLSRDRTLSKLDWKRAGVPHACFQTTHLEFNNLPLRWFEKCREIHAKLKTRGEDLNLTFYDKVDGNRARAVTFERGIDGYTLACGSGALSVADCTNSKGTSSIEMPGGKLQVCLDGPQIELTGPVRLITSIERTRWGIP